MSIIFIIVTALKIAVSLTAASTIIYWHIATKGSWRQWPAGRSLMALLTIICIGYAWRVVNRLTPDYALEEPLLAVLYAGIATALAAIGMTIHKELRAGKALVLKDNAAHDTGLVAIVVATTTEESPDDKP